MKNTFKFFAFTFLFVLIAANIYLFCSSLNLSDKINTYDSKTRALHLENLELEKKLYGLSSLTYAQKAADLLDFTEKSQPVYLEKLNFALKY